MLFVLYMSQRYYITDSKRPMIMKFHIVSNIRWLVLSQFQLFMYNNTNGIAHIIKCRLNVVYIMNFRDWMCWVLNEINSIALSLHLNLLNEIPENIFINLYAFYIINAQRLRRSLRIPFIRLCFHIYFFQVFFVNVYTITTNENVNTVSIESVYLFWIHNIWDIDEEREYLAK